MKLNSADFPVENRIIVAKEEKIYYETKKNSLADSWDRLLGYYNGKLQEEHKHEEEENELYKIMCTAKIEVETGRTVYDLIDKGILKTYRIKPRNKIRCEFKPFILESCITLLDNGSKKLKEAIEYERRVWSKLESVKFPIRLINGEIRICITKTHYIRLDENCRYIYSKSWKPKGLTCKVKYLGISLECSVPPIDTMDEVKAVEEYFLEKDLIQMFCKNDMKIEVSEMHMGDKEDSLCRCIIEELRDGGNIEDVCHKATLYLSRMLVGKVIRNSAQCKFVNYSGRVLEDGLTEVFFVLADDNIVKVLRSEAGKLELFVNEAPIRFSGLSLS